MPHSYDATAVIDVAEQAGLDADAAEAANDAAMDNVDTAMIVPIDLE